MFECPTCMAGAPADCVCETYGRFTRCKALLDARTDWLRDAQAQHAAAVAQFDLAANDFIEACERRGWVK